MIYQEFSDEQRRVLLNLAQFYEAYRDAEQDARRLSEHRLTWKTVKGIDYLYEIRDGRGNGSSLGARSNANEAKYANWQSARTRIDGAKARVAEVGRLYRALKLGAISSEAAAILREADIRGLLGKSIIVVGTNAMPVYEIEAQSRIAIGLDETSDFDMAWIGGLELARVGSMPARSPVWDLLKAVDSTYTINSERPFQARNAKAYEVELLVAPSKASTLVAGDRPVPIPLPEQEWLLQGKFVDHVVAARDGSPARIVAPDPRWFALHKLWMSDQEKRNKLKRPKDRQQGERLLETITLYLPHFPLDDDFAGELPAELTPYLDTWREMRAKAGMPTARPAW